MAPPRARGRLSTRLLAAVGVVGVAAGGGEAEARLGGQAAGGVEGAVLSLGAAAALGWIVRCVQRSAVSRPGVASVTASVTVVPLAIVAVRAVSMPRPLRVTRGWSAESRRR